MDARLPIEKKTIGKISFNFYGMKKCPLTDELMNKAVSAISKADAIIGAKTIPNLEVDEWCSPSAKGVNRMNLGKDYEIGEDVIVHEYGHNYLTLKLGEEIENVHQQYLKLALKLSQAKIDAIQKPKDCKLADDLQRLNTRYVEYERKNKYLLSIHEYFSDVFAIVVLETDTVVGRNYRKIEHRWPWSDSKKFAEDTHYALRDIWEKSYGMAKNTFGDNARKREFVAQMISTLQRDISENLETYKDKPFDVNELASRLGKKLFQ